MRLIDADALRKKHCEGCDIDIQVECLSDPVCASLMWVDAEPTVDAVEVVHGYSVGDVCFYGFASENKSLALVEITKILNDERGVAELKFLKVFVDDTGNGMFNYLLKSGKTMNGSFKYLKNITPNCGAKMEGDQNETQ